MLCTDFWASGPDGLQRILISFTGAEQLCVSPLIQPLPFPVSRPIFYVTSRSNSCICNLFRYLLMENKNTLSDSLLSNIAVTEKEDGVVRAPFLVPEIFAGRLQQQSDKILQTKLPIIKNRVRVCKMTSLTLWVAASLSTPCFWSVFCCFLKFWLH